MPSPFDPVLRRAAAQHGIVSRAEVRDLGVAMSTLDRWVGSGRLTVVHRGVYRAAGAPVTWRSELLAACIATAGMASHCSAAVQLDVEDFAPGLPEVTTSRPLRHRIDGVIVHRSRDLHLVTARAVHGIPTTPPARLVIDLGAVVSERRVEAAIQDLVRRRQLRWDDVAVAVMRHARRGRDGVGVARRIVERRLDRLVGDSPLESLLLAALADANMPAPVLQHEVHDGTRFIARLDIAWPDRGVAIEADSRVHHANDIAFEADKLKRNRLRAMGWVVHEVTWRMVMDDRRRTLSDIGASLDARPPGAFPPRSGVTSHPHRT